MPVIAKEDIILKKGTTCEKASRDYVCYCSLFSNERKCVAGPYDIAVTAGEGGKIALTEDGPPENRNVPVEEGGSLTLYIIPDNHYPIESVMVGEAPQGAVARYTL